jgi:single-strand DNA-binding protein
MNTVILMGRLTKDPQVATRGETKVARYTLAVDRRTKEKEADFISCVCFGRSADFAEMYLHHGTKIVVEGRIQTGSYTNKDGQKIYTTDVVVNSHEFAESKQSRSEAESMVGASKQGAVDSFTTGDRNASLRGSENLINGFIAVEDGDAELPFV